MPTRKSSKTSVSRKKKTKVSVSEETTFDKTNRFVNTALDFLAGFTDAVERNRRKKK